MFAESTLRHTLTLARAAKTVMVKGRERPLSIYRLAKIVGCSTTQLYDIESGERVPSPELLMGLAAALDLELEPLLTMLENEKMATSRSRLEAIREKLAVGDKPGAREEVGRVVEGLSDEDALVVDLLARHLTTDERRALASAELALQQAVRRLLVSLHQR